MCAQEANTITINIQEMALMLPAGENTITTNILVTEKGSAQEANTITINIQEMALMFPVGENTITTNTQGMVVMCAQEANTITINIQEMALMFPVGENTITTNTQGMDHQFAWVENIKGFQFIREMALMLRWGGTVIKKISMNRKANPLSLWTQDSSKGRNF
jgi:proline racemase